MSITEEQRAKIIKLLKDGSVANEEIATQAGVSPGTVSAMRSHLTMGRYDGYTGAITSDAALEQAIKAEEVTFSLERDLQAALRSNIRQLQPELEIVDGGRERTTAAGRIDITAKDRDGNTVVIELKAGTAEPEALTQLLAYMGAVQNEDGVPVRGTLIAGDFHQRVVFAAQAVPGVSLLRYRFQFTFEEV